MEQADTGYVANVVAPLVLTKLVAVMQEEEATERSSDTRRCCRRRWREKPLDVVVGF